MTDDKKEKLLGGKLSRAVANEISNKTDELAQELYKKDLRYTANILDIPIDENGVTTCTKYKHTQLLGLMYWILNYQERSLKNAKKNILADIKKRDSKLTEKLINLELSREE